MSFITDNYQWIILVSIGFSALIATIIGIIVRRKKQLKIRIYNVYLRFPRKAADMKRAGGLAAQFPIDYFVINTGDYQTVAKLIFKLKLDCKDDDGNLCSGEQEIDVTKHVEPRREFNSTARINTHINGMNWNKGYLKIYVNFNKTSGKNVTKKIYSIKIKK